jgi:hypothetical protein
MSSIRAGVRRPFGQRALGVVVALAAIVFCGSQTAVASLIFTQVQFDGAVRNNGGSGPVNAVEQHFTDTDVTAPPTSSTPLPATNPPLPAGLQAANNLSITTDFVASAPFDGGSPFYKRAMLWITSPTTGQVFKNPLDNLLATPIDFDTSVYLSELLANQQLVIKGVRVEVFGIPAIVPAANTVISNNVGSAADPIHIHLDMAANQLVLGSSSAKIFVYYDTTTRTIPEPATSTMLLAVALGAVALRRRSG